jgi:hypothetical protein
MDYKGLLSFGAGGTIVLMVFWNLMAHVSVLQGGYDTGPSISLIVTNGLFVFIGFLLVGLGLKQIIKSTKTET